MTPFRIAVLVTAWCVLTRELSLANLVVGFVLAVLLLRLTKVRAPERTSEEGGGRVRAFAQAGRRAWRRPLYALDLAGFFVWELLVSNLRIARLVLSPSLRTSTRPRILRVPVDAESEEELAVLSDLVTLTPGTLTLDVLDDGETLLVHVLAADDPDEVRSSIRDGLGRRVRRLFA